jgi:hypothetical protein
MTVPERGQTTVRQRVRAHSDRPPRTTPRRPEATAQIGTYRVHRFNTQREQVPGAMTACRSTSCDARAVEMLPASRLRAGCPILRNRFAFLESGEAEGLRPCVLATQLLRLPQSTLYWLWRCSTAPGTLPSCAARLVGNPIPQVSQSPWSTAVNSGCQRQHRERDSLPRQIRQGGCTAGRLQRDPPPRGGGELPSSRTGFVGLTRESADAESCPRIRSVDRRPGRT